MTSIKEPKLDLHIKFLRALKRLIGPRPETIFIFTTNYDLLFEIAAQNSRIPIFNGFTGTIFRYFDINSLNLKYGIIGRNRNFREINELKVNLLKLHGSISWYINNGNAFEIGNYKSLNPDECSIILPRKQKTRDTLKYPYDRIFHYTSNIIGSSQCKYIVSCGYSFRDDHINDLFILPKLRENKIRLFAFFKEEPENIELFKKFPSFNYITEEIMYVNGEEINQASNLWKFSEFVNKFAKKAGVE